jgi:putative hydrolase of the HAD superfamily
VRHVRAVTLDAAGTLITPASAVGSTYAAVAAANGILADAAAVDARFHRALAAAPPLAFPQLDAAARPARERAWWAAVVGEALDAAAAGPRLDACVDTLMAHYASPRAWRVFPDVAPALRALRARGRRLAIVSNFDGRLPALLEGLGIRALVDTVVHSTAAGAAKPDARIFVAAVRALGVELADTVHAGDDPAADVAGARAAGLAAVLVDRDDRHAATRDTPRVADLGALVALLDAR